MIPAAFDALFLEARTHHHWLGYADHSQLVMRRPRLAFEDACRII